MGSIKCTQQQLKSLDEDLNPITNNGPGKDLVFVMASSNLMHDPALHERLMNWSPDATMVGCTTAGEITGQGVEDETVTITSLSFEETSVQTTRAPVTSMGDSYQAGASLAQTLYNDDLAYLLILSDGLAVNGSSLVKGVRDTLPDDLPFSGGLAGDAGRFEKTFTLDNDGTHENNIIGVGFYGKSLNVRRGSVGGWAPFGPLRTVTRSRDNIVYEIDKKSALDVYSTYLGDEANDLPASGLLFPLAISPESGETGLIRTLLAIDREKGSLTFAGDVPEKTTVQLMHANYDQLIYGAEKAAEECLTDGFEGYDFALLISCVGRKLLLGNNTDLEVDAVMEKLGRGITCTGFYSYGEIGPFQGTGTCELHNQTMTVTVLKEGN